jgi:hypothetical protein
MGKRIHKQAPLTEKQLEMGLSQCAALGLFHEKSDSDGTLLYHQTVFGRDIIDSLHAASKQESKDMYQAMGVILNVLKLFPSVDIVDLWVDTLENADRDQIARDMATLYKVDSANQDVVD